MTSPSEGLLFALAGLPPSSKILLVREVEVTWILSGKQAPSRGFFRHRPNDP